MLCTAPVDNEMKNRNPIAKNVDETTFEYRYNAKV